MFYNAPSSGGGLLDKISVEYVANGMCSECFQLDWRRIIDGDCNSRDDCHQADEEDSAATSISDAMIDDEIADQPGLVMLGQVLHLSLWFVFDSIRFDGGFMGWSRV